MQDLDFRYEASKDLLKPFPRPAGSLTPPAKLPPPHAQHFVPKRLHSSLVVRDRMVLVIAANHPLEPLPNVLHLLVYALAQRLPNLLQLGRHSLADRLPVHRKAPVRVILPTDVSKTKKIKGSRLPFPSLPPPFRGIAPELNQT